GGMSGGIAEMRVRARKLKSTRQQDDEYEV
ncbi:hypothetical protein LCGC14_2623990, partial [marine sediment metagenome]